MMIIDRQFYNIQCDHCGKLLDEETWWGEKDLVEGLILDECGWIECEGRHYCDECWSRDDDDNIVTKDGRKWTDDDHKRIYDGVDLSESNDATKKQLYAILIAEKIKSKFEKMTYEEKLAFAEKYPEFVIVEKD